MQQRKQKVSKGGRQRLSVVLRSEGWAIAGYSAAIERRPYRTQREAVEAARRLIKTQVGGELAVHGRDGRIRSVDTYALGGRSFDKISAVEGLHISHEMRNDFSLLDRRKYSPERRREWLIAKYGPQGDGIRRRK